MYIFFISITIMLTSVACNEQKLALQNEIKEIINQIHQVESTWQNALINFRNNSYEEQLQKVLKCQNKYKELYQQWSKKIDEKSNLVYTQGM